MRPFWRFRLREHPKKVNEVEEERNILLKFGLTRYTLPPEDVSELWKRIQQDNDLLHGKINKRSSRIYRWYWVAAAVLLMGVTVSLLLTIPGQFEYRTAFGETKTIVLADSSTVILNANSHISFDKNWEQRPVREIWLEGEAYFSVVHKQNHQPFKVSTPGGIAVEVLGTTFNVYHRAVETKVVLNSGQISLSFPVDKKEKKILMKPGNLWSIRKTNTASVLWTPAFMPPGQKRKSFLTKLRCGK